MSESCKYYAEDNITLFEPKCREIWASIHPDDVEGEFCQFCGKKIKWLEHTSPRGEVNLLKIMSRCLGATMNIDELNAALEKDYG